MAELYCLDTSVLIESWCNLYRPTSFPSLWEKLEEAIVQGRFIAPELVLEELKRKEDDVFKWAKQQKGLFFPLEVELQNAHEKIINDYPRLIDQAKFRSMCDPWVIALAQLRKCSVVTQEDYGSDNKPKIPDVCRKLSIDCIKIADLIQELKWVF